MSFVQKEDVLIYLRWLSTYFYSQKSFQQCIKALEWLSYQMNTELLAQNIVNKQTTKNDNIRRCFENRSNHLIGEGNSISNNKNSLSSYLNIKFKTLDNMYLSSSNATVPRDEVLNSISYSNIHF